MKEEHKALLGKECYVDVDGERQTGRIVDLVESVTTPKTIILYCVQLLSRPTPLQAHYDVGTDTVELHEREGGADEHNQNG